MVANDERFLRAALREAKKALGQTSPNPSVGAVIVSEGEIIARGFHRGAGLPHAEIEALKKLPDERMAKNATLYVTLEPCSTHGRTPPCAEAIIRAGIARVVIGTIDPNPKHAGRGIELLRTAGIEVAVSENKIEAECRELNAAFNHWIVSKTPFVTAKCGMSLDGKLTRPPGESQWLTSERSRADAHKLRAQADAILVGAETVRTDNPRLTIRGQRRAHDAKQPWRVVLTRSGNLPANSHLFTDEHKARTLVFKKKSLRAVLRELAKREVTSVLIEGGGDLLGHAFDQRLVHRAVFYIAPFFVGGDKIAVSGRGAGASSLGARIKNPACRKIGPDLRVSGEVEYP